MSLFTWDPEKREANLLKHGIDFLDAQKAFDGFTITTEDIRSGYYERRFLTLGMVGGQVVCIAHTEREDSIRIISMRKATKYETQRYFSEIGSRP